MPLSIYQQNYLKYCSTKKRIDRNLIHGPYSSKKITDTNAIKSNKHNAKTKHLSESNDIISTAGSNLVSSSNVLSRGKYMYEFNGFPSDNRTIDFTDCTDDNNNNNNTDDDIKKLSTAELKYQLSEFLQIKDTPLQFHNDVVSSSTTIDLTNDADDNTLTDCINVQTAPTISNLNNHNKTELLQTDKYQMAYNCASSRSAKIDLTSDAVNSSLNVYGAAVQPSASLIFNDLTSVHAGRNLVSSEELRRHEMKYKLNAGSQIIRTAAADNFNNNNFDSLFELSDENVQNLKTSDSIDELTQFENSIELSDLLQADDITETIHGTPSSNDLKSKRRFNYTSLAELARETFMFCIDDSSPINTANKNIFDSLSELSDVKVQNSGTSNSIDNLTAFENGLDAADLLQIDNITEKLRKYQQ